MNLYEQYSELTTRRHFLRQCKMGLGSVALASLMGKDLRADVGSGPSGSVGATHPLAVRPPNFAPKAKRVIYLHMSGGPPQHDLFDYKPKLVEMNGTACPKEFTKGERFPFIKGEPKLLGTPHKFKQYGQAGTWVSDILPNFQTIVDDVAVVKSMWTNQFNHAPAEMLLYTGSERAGQASMGSWITYGLGSENQDLPGFVVLVSGGTDPTGGKALWSSGFLPSVFQGVQCRTRGEPILYVNDPKGMNRDTRRRSLDALRKLNELELQAFGDPETLTRISQYELAYRMQMAVPEVMDISKEPANVIEAYGAQPGQAAFANNVLLARRLIERGVRYVQLFDWGWDIHGTAGDNDIFGFLPKKCATMDKPVTALIKDLKQRGLLDETLVIWGGEFGRTPLNEERDGSKFFGRDHHPHCFTLWMAGGGVKPGISYGETDELGYFVTKDKVPVHDLQATVLHLLGMDPFKFGYMYQGLNQRLIGPTNEPQIVKGLLA